MQSVSPKTGACNSHNSHRRNRNHHSPHPPHNPHLHLHHRQILNPHQIHTQTMGIYMFGFCSSIQPHRCNRIRIHTCIFIYYELSSLNKVL